MPRATPNSVMALTLAGAVVVLCGGLMVMMEYAKSQLKVKERYAEKPAAPMGPYAARIRELELKEFAVTQLNEDDRSGSGRYVQTTEQGLYLDIVSREVVFSSRDKLEPALGHAEFSKPFDAAGLAEEPATVLGEPRVEVRWKASGSRLGWIFTGEDGTRRYVINSSALHFVPAADLEKHGLGQHRALFPAATPR